ncbi:MAG: hypothetical protein KDA27_12665 [Candidatus Eisenbacteria bacterium]|uniref:Uncharacterized protein n=1 Tax=Eiseniibacteriota bacterium TaxID=2212470 RepID=A0A956NF29_UNCEI|nr:hypothetical protein [Candidatus Eisenbacteria bacterium]
MSRHRYATIHRRTSYLYRTSRIAGWIGATVLCVAAAGCSGRDKVTEPGPGGGGGGGGQSALPAEQVALLGDVFRAGWSIQDAVRDSNEFLAQAAFIAGELFGTLTQVGNTEQFEYQNQPNDRLRIVFSNGETVEIVATTFQGDVNSDWETFLSAHSLAYTIASSVWNLQITSERIPQDSFQKNVSQTVQGTVLEDGVTWNVQGTVTGTEIFVFSESSTTTHDSYTIAGSFGQGTAQISVSQFQDYKNDFFSGSGNTFIEKSDTIASSGTDGTTSIAFGEVVYSWSDTEDRDPIYQAEGAISRNGASLGTLVTNSASGEVGILLGTGESVAF